MLLRILKSAGVLGLLAVVAALALLVNVFPQHPTSVRGWLVFVALALPILVIGELIGNAIFENRFVRSIGKNSQSGRISWARVTYGVVALLLLAVGCGVAATYLLR